MTETCEASAHSDLMRRIGRFTLSNRVIRGNPQFALDALRDCLVLRAEQRFDLDGIEYVAAHKDFTALPPGLMAPTYQAESTIYTDGSEVFARWVR